MYPTDADADPDSGFPILLKSLWKFIKIILKTFNEYDKLFPVNIKFGFILC
jgi:hypothetical protein